MTQHLTAPSPTAGRSEAVAEILAELQAGAPVEGGFRRLFEIYYTPLYRFFARRGFHPDECLDLTQETFLGIYTGIGSFRREAGFETWMWKIATNAYRKRRRWWSADKRAGQEVPLEAAGELAAVPAAGYPAGTVPPPGEEAMARERSRLLREAIERLPDQMRKCLMLRVYQDLKYREIAAVLRLSTETVKAHLFQARRRLQEELGDYFRAALAKLEESRD